MANVENKEVGENKGNTEDLVNRKTTNESSTPNPNSTHISLSMTSPEYEKNLILKLINDGNVELKTTKEEETYMLNILLKYSRFLEKLSLSI